MLNKSALYICLSVSGLIHSAVLFTVSSDNRVNFPSSPHQPVISAHIKYPDNSKSPSQLKHTINNKHVVARNPKKIIKPVLTAKSDGSDSVKQQNMTRQDIDKNAPAIKQNIFRARVIAQVRADFARHFYYPRLAVSRNWQGRVVIYFNVSIQGNIENIRIAQSSGYDILDNAALSSMQNIKTVRNDSFQHIAVQLPVIYKLQGS